MWTFIVFCILGLNIHQANGEGNSTQMYYVKLTIDASAIPTLRTILKTFVSNNRLKVDDLKMTTECKNVTDGTECECLSDFKWSNKVCQSNPKCCHKKKCTFTGDSAGMCVSKDAVTTNGSIALKGEKYHNCLRDKETKEFKDCNNNLLVQMKSAYSILRGFDTLTIQNYSVGSVIAEFEMTIAEKVKLKEFVKISSDLCKTVSGTLKLDTKGVVKLTMPNSHVCNADQPILKCNTSEDLGTTPRWEMKGKLGKSLQIFNGTESMVKNDLKETTVRLSNISEIWKGVYTCAYEQMSDHYTITHKASGVLDISLKPNIDITTSPTFPQCKDSSALVDVRVKCEIGNNNETYNVTWFAQNILGEIKPAGFAEAGNNKLVYVADAVIKCKEQAAPQLTCQFTNRCDEKRNASTTVTIIYENDPFCSEDGEWKMTKAGYSAVLKCKNEAGQRTRKCNPGSPGIWEPEISQCVNKEVDSVLRSAIIADIGLGSLDENAANVFSLFEDVTHNSETINTYGNMNASVEVLSSLRNNLQSINDETTANNFLESSSNMLESSLNESWTTKSNSSNISLAQRYLSSVENLIKMTNLTGVKTKKNIQLASFNCTEMSKCENKVFNATVDLGSQGLGNIKIAAFKELQMYLPNSDVEFEPNSMVVSTLVSNEGRRQIGGTYDITINFQLNHQRLRHHKMKCVSWNEENNSWETTCSWGGAFAEGQCKCKKFSSFAILMSRYPVQIEGLTEVSYVGLSVSIVSLIVSLVIELIVWRAVVKTKNLYLRHTAHMNISLCLLIADACFLASSYPEGISKVWCQVSVVLKHFCYLSMFFWMLCLSSMLLHQTVFPFHNFGKKTYLRLSLLMGYVCPLLIVFITFLCNSGGAEGVYFSEETCWLVYIGVMEGSIHTFIIPIGIIAIFNVFSMLVVIMKLLDRPKIKDRSNDKEKQAAITVLRSVVLLTPIFGVTWIFGFAVMLLDLTMGWVAILVNYAFTLMNAFQGLFILLATCLGDKLIREALLNHCKKIAPASTTDSTIKLDSAGKK